MPDSRATEQLLPPASDPRAVGRRVFDLLHTAMQAKIDDGLHDMWARFRRLGRNRPWKGTTPAGVPLSSANLLHMHRQRTVNTLTDNSPSFNVTRVGDGGDEDAFLTMERLARHWWIEQEQQAALEKSVINGETYGVAVEKVVFDPDLEYGLGEVRTVVVDPFRFAVYPPRCLDVQEAAAVFHLEPLSLREIDRRFPHAAGQARSDAALLDELGDPRREAVRGHGGRRGFLSRLGEVAGAVFGAAGRSRLPGDEAVVCECWVRDFSMDGDAPRYPGGVRCVTVCNGGDLVLADRGNPCVNPLLPPHEASRTYLYDKYPFVVANSVTDPASLWGASDFEQLENLQMEINKCLSQLTYHKDRCARPKIINPRDSGVANAAFNNRLGIINPASQAAASGIRYLEFANNTKDIETVLGIYKELFLQVAGSHEMEQAVDNARPVIAHKAIAALLEQAATMMRGKIRNYSRLIRERGRMFLSHAQNWYAEDRFITFATDAGPTAIPVRGAVLRVPARLSVVSGSTMPVSRVQQREEALALFEMGAIDRRDLLEKLEWSGREALLGRLDGVAGGPVPARTPPPGALSDAGERPARADGDDVGVVPEKAL
jgi:hypothetical protein